MHFTALLLPALASLTLAQQTYTIDPNNVKNTTRQAWCDSQKQQCPLICLQLPGSAGANVNTCDPNLLQYQCICTNGQSPNVTQFTQTLPYFICTEWGQECVANCGNNNLCAAKCLQDHPCGAQSVSHPNTTSIEPTQSSSKTGSSSATSATTTAATYTNLPGSTSYTAGAASFRPAILQFGQAWGVVTMMIGIFGAFTILL